MCVKLDSKAQFYHLPYFLFWRVYTIMYYLNNLFSYIETVTAVKLSSDLKILLF